MAKQQLNKRQAQPEMIRCENCGEDYSATYRCCPFCDERPGRRIDEYGLSSKNPLQLAVLIGTLVVILAAAFIVFSKVAPLLSSREPAEPEISQPNEEAPITGSDLVPGKTEDPVTPDTPADPQPETPTDSNAVPTQAIVLSREDFTLLPGETYTLTATISPADSTNVVVWSCDRPDILTVNQDGTVTNKNATGEKVAVTLTVLSGTARAECIVRCNSSAASGSSTGSSTGSESGSQSGGSTGSTGSTVAKNTDAKVVGAGSGLNVRSGPGSNYEKVASIKNGNSVVILEDLGNGWYKIDYGAGKTGYASAQFIQPK